MNKQTTFKIGTRVKGTGSFDGSNHEYTGTVTKVNRKTLDIVRDGSTEPQRCEIWVQDDPRLNQYGEVIAY